MNGGQSVRALPHGHRKGQPDVLTVPLVLELIRVTCVACPLKSADIFGFAVYSAIEASVLNRPGHAGDLEDTHSVVTAFEQRCASPASFKTRQKNHTHTHTHTHTDR